VRSPVCDVWPLSLQTLERGASVVAPLVRRILSIALGRQWPLQVIAIESSAGEPTALAHAPAPSIGAIATGSLECRRSRPC
jgi:hypothetical protein